jgi:hypothetical protein
MIREQADRKGPTLRTQRLTLTWLLAPPFLFLARPSGDFLVAGAALSAMGLLLRGLAAGSIHKDRSLASGGVYGHLRHPLYLGSFLLGLGFSLAGGRWWFPVVFASLFIWVYRRTVKVEERELRLRFGDPYEEYRRETPAFWPRIRRRLSIQPSPGFTFRLYRRNKEWQAMVGTALGFAILWAKMVFFQ